jgi:hypothetical protein
MDFNYGILSYYVKYNFILRITETKNNLMYLTQTYDNTDMI